MPEASATVERVTSRDGTPIAYWRSGIGPPIVLVHGTTSAHWGWRFLAPRLTNEFTVCALDRRGRGESGDTANYALEREFEDVAAVVDSLGEPASLFGHSYGATVALGAALLAQNLSKLVAYEPAPGIEGVTRGDLKLIETLVAEGKREEALIFALRAFGLSDEELDEMQASPTWPERVAAAHTVAREVRAEADFDVGSEPFGQLERPALLLLGEQSPEWARLGTEVLRSALPDATVAVLPGQGHMAIMTAPELVVKELTGFLSE